MGTKSNKYSFTNCMLLHSSFNTRCTQRRRRHLVVCANYYILKILCNLYLSPEIHTFATSRRNIEMKKLMTVFVVWYGAPPTAKHIFLHKGSGSRLSGTRSDSSTIRGTVSSVAPSSGFLVKTKRMILCIIYFL